ncbi:hypothetical protein [Mycolicibacterium aromaticivorans]|nr:hypothetical protein [Mycolicibacterium aromaticivorans]
MDCADRERFPKCRDQRIRATAPPAHADTIGYLDTITARPE